MYCFVIIIIIIPDLYRDNSLRSALQYKGEQYSYNTVRYRRNMRAHGHEAYILNTYKSQNTSNIKSMPSDVLNFLITAKSLLIIITFVM